MRSPAVAGRLATQPSTEGNGEVNSTAVPTRSRVARPTKARRLLAAVACVGVFGLAIAPAALAADSSVDTYAGNGGQVATQVQAGEGGSATVSDPGGSLPFTGFDLALAAGGGLVLLLAGRALALLVPSAKGKPS